MIFGLTLFNLLLNAAIALAMSLALVWLAARSLRISMGRLRVALLMMPLLKAAFELVRGIPDDAFFWAKLAGQEQELGSFNVGFGVQAPALPVVELSLGALSGGREYAQSAADLLATLLARQLAPWVPPVLGALLAAVGLFRLLTLLWASVRAARMHARCLRSARQVGVRRLGMRRVRIFVTPEVSGVPFAGGLFRPWIILPSDINACLSTEEREAVIAHEIAHLAHHDLTNLTVAAALGAVFGFVPGVAALVRAIRANTEIAADAAARRAVSATTLAATLVHVAELLHARPSRVAQMALLRTGPLLSRRVMLLLNEQPSSSARMIALRSAGVLLTLALVMRATLFGNP